MRRYALEQGCAPKPNRERDSQKRPFPSLPAEQRCCESVRSKETLLPAFGIMSVFDNIILATDSYKVHRRGTLAPCPSGSTPCCAGQALLPAVEPVQSDANTQNALCEMLRCPTIASTRRARSTSIRYAAASRSRGCCRAAFARQASTPAGLERLRAPATGGH